MSTDKPYLPEDLYLEIDRAMGGSGNVDPFLYPSDVLMLYELERKRRERLAEEERKKAEKEAERRRYEELRREIIERGKKAKREALSRLKEAEGRIKELESLRLADIEMQRQLAQKLAGRAIKVAGLTEGALSRVLTGLQEVAGQQALKAQQLAQAGLAEISRLKAQVEAGVPVDFERLGLIALQLEAQMRQAEAAMLSAEAQMRQVQLEERGPNFFDALLSAGGLFLAGLTLI